MGVPPQGLEHVCLEIIQLRSSHDWGGHAGLWKSQYCQSKLQTASPQENLTKHHYCNIYIERVHLTWDFIAFVSILLMVVQRCIKRIKKMFPGSRMLWQKLVFWQKLTYMGLEPLSAKTKTRIGFWNARNMLSTGRLGPTGMEETWCPMHHLASRELMTMMSSSHHAIFFYSTDINSLLIIFTDCLLNHEKVRTDVFQSQ